MKAWFVRVISCARAFVQAVPAQLYRFWVIALYPWLWEPQSLRNMQARRHAKTFWWSQGYGEVVSYVVWGGAKKKLMARVIGLKFSIGCRIGSPSQESRAGSDNSSSASPGMQWEEGRTDSVIRSDVKACFQLSCSILWPCQLRRPLLLAVPSAYCKEVRHRRLSSNHCHCMVSASTWRLPKLQSQREPGEGCSGRGEETRVEKLQPLDRQMHLVALAGAQGWQWWSEWDPWCAE